MLPLHIEHYLQIHLLMEIRKGQLICMGILRMSLSLTVEELMQTMDPLNLYITNLYTHFLNHEQKGISDSLYIN